MEGPLDGILVADFTRVLSGPYCTMVLGDLGADVIKVERPGSGDETRRWGPPFAGSESAYYLSINRNKRSVALDLERPDHLQAALRLCRAADVVAENFRPGTAERLGLGYETLRDSNPRVVYASITGFGSGGPERDRPGYDFVVQGMGGLMSVTGEPDRMPVKVGVAISDITTGLFAAIGILAALRERDVSGEGRHVEVSLFDSQVAWLANQAANWLIGGLEPTRMGNRHPNIVPYEAFEASDGPFIVAVGNEGAWRRLCGVAGLDALAGDERFATNAARVRNREALSRILAERFRSSPRGRWLSEMHAAGVAAGPINSIPEVFEDPLGAECVEEVPHPTIGDLRLVRSPLRFAGERRAARRHPPLLGEHTEEVLRALGYPAVDVRRMCETSGP